MAMKVLKIFFALPKTIYLNFKLFPFRDAFKLPIWVAYNTKVVISGEAVRKPIRIVNS